MVEKLIRRQEVLMDFRLDQVKLKGKYQVNAFEKELQYLKEYKPDRLLAGFRETKGLEPRDDKYPGWENTEIRGHTLGHYLTACAQAYAQTKDLELWKRLNYIIEELQQCQFESGYLSAFPETFFDRVENRQPVWVPWYTMHKIIAGLIAVFNSAGIQEALQIVSSLGNWVYSRTTRWSEELQTIVLSIEYGGMNDCMYDLYNLTRDVRHLEAAHKFDEIPLFSAIRDGRNILKGKHANTTIPKFIGALKRYLVLGESESFYLEATANFWEMVVHNHSYITGGNSENEHFREPNVLNHTRSDVTCETCNSYNMLKLTKELYKLTGDIKYADFYERTYMNAILSSQHPETGMTMYFQPMATGYFKVYSSPFEHFWCCTGTGMESFSKLNDSIYYKSDNCLYITQYTESIVDWEEQEAMIIMHANIPASDEIVAQLRIKERETKHLVIHFRIPYWVCNPVEIRINGNIVHTENEESYVVLDRNWNDGDIISFSLPMRIQATRLPDNPNVVGFQYGPVVLSAALGTEDMSISQTGILVQVPDRKMIVKDFIIPHGMSPEQWIVNAHNYLAKDDSRVAFRPLHTDEYERLLFTPHYEQYRERYGIYWNVVDGNSDELREHKERIRMEQVIKEATIDSIQVGNDQYELRHDIVVDDTVGGAWNGLNGRIVYPGGWVRYRLKVIPGEKNMLQVTYSGTYTNRVMTIEANGQPFVIESSSAHYIRSYITKRYLIPDELIGIDEYIEITFKPDEQQNGIYGILRTMRPID